MQKQKLVRIVGRLEDLQVSRDVVLDLFKDIKALKAQDFFDCALFSADRPYGRKMLYYSRNVEVLIMGFLPEGACPPHDHGEADGLVLVCHGIAFHKVFRREGDSLTLIADTRELSGQILDAPVGCVHSMENASKTESLITLHVYWPPIRQMSVFDLKEKRIYVVNDKAGAWLPVEPATLLETRELM